MEITHVSVTYVPWFIFVRREVVGIIEKKNVFQFDSQISSFKRPNFGQNHKTYFRICTLMQTILVFLFFILPK